MAKSTELLQQFQKDFGINMTIDEAEKMIRRFAYLDNFLFENPSKNPEKDAYKKVLNYMFDKYVENAMKPEQYEENKPSSKNYDQASFDSESFVGRFEEIMQARFEENPANEGKERKPMEGFSKNALRRHLGERAKRYGAMEKEWAERLKKGVYKLEDLKKVTDATAAWAKDPNNTGSLDSNPSFQTTALAYKAMKQLVASRSGFWRFWIWNWDRDKQEKAYLAQLEAEVKEINGKFDNAIDKLEIMPINKISEKIEKELLAAKVAKVEAQKGKEAEEIVAVDFNDMFNEPSTEMAKPIEQPIEKEEITAVK